MKFSRLMFPIVLLLLATVAFAQHEMQTSTTQPAPSDAHKSFVQLKSLAGTWQGPVTVDPPQPEIKNGELGQITLRVTSRGNALVHEMKDPTKPDDPTKYDHPVTMFYLDNDRLTLVHYCDAGNRPRMVARSSPDGKTLEFDFVDVSGSTKYGNMYHAVFTTIDANHHIEDWTYMTPGNKPIHARMDLTRAQ